MPDNIVERLVETFRHFPGTGPRQARRFIYHLLREGRGTIDNFVNDLRELHAVVTQCEQCFRFYSSLDRPGSIGQARICDLCVDSSRDHATLMIVEKDADLEVIRQSGTYQGHFFVLGGLVPILEKAPRSKIRLRELVMVVERKLTDQKLQEIIIALAANPEGDNTSDCLRKTLAPYMSKIKVTVLGRGLSTGTELEYSDAETIKNALKNRA